MASNNDFEDAVYRFVAIAHNSTCRCRPYPVFSYGFDQESANFTRDAFEETVSRVAQDPTVGDITIMGHSMGAWLVMESLRQMAIRRGHLPQHPQCDPGLPDIDVDVFRTQWLACSGRLCAHDLHIAERPRVGPVAPISSRIDRLSRLMSAPPTTPLSERRHILVIDPTGLRGGDT